MEFTTKHDILHALQSIDELEKEGTTNKTFAHFRPYHFVLLALAMSRQRARHFSMEGVDPDIIRYACRMHLWNALGLEPPDNVRERDHRGRFRPLTALDNPEVTENVSNDLAGLFQDTGSESVDSIGGAVSELLGNCYSHSGIADGKRGFVCAQRWPNGNKAQIAIGDSGMGVRESVQNFVGEA